MDNSSDLYSTSNYHMFKASMYGGAAFLVLLAFLFYVSRLLQNPIIGVLGWILLCTIPFLFQRKFKRAFSSKVELLFNDLNVLIKEYKGNNLIKETTITYSEIKSYRFQFMRSDVTNLNIIFKAKSTKSFFFIDEKYTNESPEEISVYSLFVKYIKMYNADKSDENKILTKRNVFSSGSADL